MSGTRARRPADAAVAAGLSGVRRYAFTAYRWLLLAFLLGGCVQIFLAGVLVVQTTPLQSLLAGPADDAALYGGLHALDGLLVLGIAGFLYATSRRRA